MLPGFPVLTAQFGVCSASGGSQGICYRLQHSALDIYSRFKRYRASGGSLDMRDVKATEAALRQGVRVAQDAANGTKFDAQQQVALRQHLALLQFACIANPFEPI